MTNAHELDQRPQLDWLSRGLMGALFFWLLPMFFFVVIALHTFFFITLSVDGVVERSQRHALEVCRSPPVESPPESGAGPHGALDTPLDVLPVAGTGGETG